MIKSICALFNLLLDLINNAEAGCYNSICKDEDGNITLGKCSENAGSEDPSPPTLDVTVEDDQPGSAINIQFDPGSDTDNGCDVISVDYIIEDQDGNTITSGSGPLTSGSVAVDVCPYLPDGYVMKATVTDSCGASTEIAPFTFYAAVPSNIQCKQTSCGRLAILVDGTASVANQSSSAAASFSAWMTALTQSFDFASTGMQVGLGAIGSGNIAGVVSSPFVDNQGAIDFAILLTAFSTNNPTLEDSSGSPGTSIENLLAQVGPMGAVPSGCGQKIVIFSDFVNNIGTNAVADANALKAAGWEICAVLWEGGSEGSAGAALAADIGDSVFKSSDFAAINDIIPYIVSEACEDLGGAC